MVVKNMSAKAFETCCVASHHGFCVADVSCSLQTSTCTRQRNELQSVDRYTCGTPHFSHAQSLHSTDDTCVWLKTSSLSCAPKTLTSSTHQGSSFAARDTEHFLTISFFYLSCVVFVYLSDSRPVAHASINPLRRSTAGWHFCGLPTSHTKCLFSSASVHSHVIFTILVAGRSLAVVAERFVLKTMFGVASRILGSAVGSFHGGRDRSQVCG